MFGSSATSMSKFDSSAASTCSKYLSPKKLINEVNDIDKSLNVLDVTDDILTKSDSKYRLRMSQKCQNSNSNDSDFNTQNHEIIAISKDRP